MLPKKISKRETISVRVEDTTKEQIDYLKNEKFIDTSSWLRSVIAKATKEAVALVNSGGQVSYGSTQE